MSISSRTIVPGFEVVQNGGTRVLARPEAVSWVRYVLDAGKTLHAYAAEDRKGSRLEGRSPVFVIPAKTPSEKTPSGESPVHGQAGFAGRWAVRHFVRGGRVFSTLFGDRYLRVGAVRPFLEVEASEEARWRGIATPRVVAAASYPTGPFYRADLVTEFIPEASDLVQALFDTSRKGAGGALERLDTLRTAGELVRQLAAVGLRHRDLHAGNILLQWQGAAPRAHLLDLDLSLIHI